MVVVIDSSAPGRVARFRPAWRKCMAMTIRSTSTIGVIGLQATNTIGYIGNPIQGAVTVVDGGSVTVVDIPRKLSTSKGFNPLEVFAVPLPVRCDEVKEVGAGVFGHDPFPLYPAEILLLKIVNIPLSGQLVGAPAGLLVKTAAL